MMAAQSDNNAASSGQGISSDLVGMDLPSKRLLGKGLASIVYETEWNGERFARKDFIGVPSGAFQKEAAILVGLEDHENVVKTHARTVDKMSCSLVLEYMEDDLLDLLQKRKESQRGASGTASGSRCGENPSYPFELSEALAILSQIARGMEFLHDQNIPHGDLKTKNILVSHINDGDKSVLSVKVADFGLVRTKSKSMSFVSRQARKLDVVQWKAPEVLERLLSEDNDVTTSESDSNSETERTGSLSVSDRLCADVYSFAVTCSQILTGEVPYPNGNWKELGPKIVSGELRPNLPAACPGLLKSLLESCWTKSVARRPSFSFIRELLDFWLVDPEVRGHLSLKEVREKIDSLDSPPPLAKKPMIIIRPKRRLRFKKLILDLRPPPLAKKPMIIIRPKRRLRFKKLILDLRPPKFKRKILFGAYEPEEVERAEDAINYYMGSNLPYHYSDSPLIFAGIPLKEIQFKDLKPSGKQFIQVGNSRMLASAVFGREVRAAILTVTGKCKKSVSVERKPPLGSPPRETSSSISHENISSIKEERGLPSSKILLSGEDSLMSKLLDQFRQIWQLEEPRENEGAAAGKGGSSSSSESDPPVGIIKVNDAVFKLCEPSIPLEVEIVFIHGLQLYGFADAYWKTWIAGKKDADGKEFCWPIAWLSEDLPGARIWSISYDSSAFKTSKTGNRDGFLLGEGLVQNMVDLTDIGQKDRPIVFVCHSLGGIVVKEIVIKAHTDFRNDQKYVNFLRNIRGFHFYATPHDGSKLADLAAHLPKMGKMVDELRVINNELGRRNQQFERIEGEDYGCKWKFAVVAEQHETKAYGVSVKVVEETSARYRTGRFLAVAADHFGVCKPESQLSSSYQSLSKFITTVMGEQRLTQSTVAERKAQAVELT